MRFQRYLVMPGSTWLAFFSLSALSLLNMVLVQKKLQRSSLSLEEIAEKMATMVMTPFLDNDTSVAAAFSSPLLGKSGSDGVIVVAQNHVEDQQPQQNATTQRSVLIPIPPNSDYAYAFLIGGCGPENPGYKGFLWSTMVSTEIFRSHNSTADVVLLVQMAGTTETLPYDEERALYEMRIRVHYLPHVTTLNHTSFYDAVLEKFRILELVEYQRVMFLDADVMPLDTSFDYMFTASLLKPNVLRATRAEPANAGFFVLEPGPGKFDQLQEIIDRREIDALNRTLHHNFDNTMGWGVSLAPTGGWKGTHQGGNNWKFWYGAADQGLLYYWAKFIEQNVTLLIGETFENWGSRIDEDSGVRMPVLEASYPAPFDDFRGISMQPFYKNSDCITNHAKKGSDSAFCHEPVRSLHHFYGKNKPWTHMPPRDFRTVGTATKTALGVFFYYFDKVNRQYNLGLDLDDWSNEQQKIKGLPLGSSNDATLWGDLDRRIERRRPYLVERAKQLNLTLIIPPAA
jgi:hypothetical protein